MKKIMTFFSLGVLMLFSLLAFGAVGTNSTDDGEIKLAHPIQFLYGDLDNNNKRDPGDPLIVMAADDYKKIFGEVPLERMLRSQIGDKEFIALDQDDLDKLDKTGDSKIGSTEEETNYLYKIYFAKISGTINGSYIATTAQMVSFGKLKEILLNVPPDGHAKAKHNQHNKDDKQDLINEAEFQGHRDVEIKETQKKTDDDMPWMGL